ncbi:MULTISPECIES: thiamine phosphate synthase [Leptospira]|uniref:thiamine phosphate synthase n=1 Tax=Leptospira TaxID=171 RepID=UPI0002BF54B4|nr:MULTISPECIES: thiamine phosphate synthase [Leptospira]EMK09510.1 putative thiamine-phosphate diphosphorylase [Leptospira kirschneri]KXZ26156.1 thiamine monophosphate synthase [Leptospira kirschneri]KXZ30549.1 thiamine monophosphate synthase [Leptospira sp. ZV016]
MRAKSFSWRVPGIYPILDLDFCKSRNLDYFSLPKFWMEYPDLIPFVQIRAKSASINELEFIVKSLQDLYPDLLWIVNDFWKQAIEWNCFGAHVGKEDYESLNLEEKNTLFESKLYLGTSSHTLEEVNELDSSLWNYTGLGPIFPTENKEDAKSAIGTKTLNKIKNGNYLPVTVIGGIKVENLDLILKEGSFLISSISMACLENEFRTAVTKLRK